jgi:kynurenine formamidase
MEAQAMELIDLSQTLTQEMPRFSPDWPGPEISAWMSHAQSAESGRYQGCTCEISEVRFITSLGTYLDSPYHFHPGAASVEALGLDQLVLPGVVVDCRGVQPRSPLGPQALAGYDIKGKAVLFHTGWSRYWGEPQYADHPFLTRAAARALEQGGARLAGVDFLVIDDRQDPQRPVHVTLLGRQILIVENLTNLDSLPKTGFTFHAAPVKVAGAAAFPVRAYAVLDRDLPPSALPGE